MFPFTVYGRYIVAGDLSRPLLVIRITLARFPGITCGALASRDAVCKNQ